MAALWVDIDGNENKLPKDPAAESRPHIISNEKQINGLEHRAAVDNIEADIKSNANNERLKNRFRQQRSSTAILLTSRRFKL